MAKAEKAETPSTSGRTKAGKSDKSQQTKQSKPKIQERFSRQLMKVGFFRRRYVKRMIRYIDKSKAKGKRLPPELYDLQRFLSQVPKGQRAERLEEAITAQQTDEPIGNRDLRRSSANQNRLSGRGPGHYRPGAPPRSMQPGPKPPKRPR
jgi:hypothetical protein